MKNHARNALIALLALMFILSMIRFAKATSPPTMNLPGAVNARYHYHGATSYWDITLSSVLPGYDVTNGLYVGWCCDETFTINNDATLTGVKLYSSYDTADPYTHNVDPGDWNKVNYIINNKQGTPDDVQTAIWHYINSGGGTIDAAVTAMINAADANGGFVPTHGQLLAVVLYLANSQTTFIEVTVPTVQLTVTSAYDTPTPTSGSYTPGDGITVSVTPIVAGPTGTQYVCTGWTGTGSVPASGTATTVTFAITQDSSITWNWKTQYYLTVSSAYDSPTGAGWYDSGTSHTFSISPTAISGGVKYIFLGWSSSDPNEYAGPLTSSSVTMNNAITETAKWLKTGPPSVGGEWAPITLQVMSPISAVQLVATWIALALIAAASAFAAYRRWFKKHW
jgi:hypothetical protein